MSRLRLTEIFFSLQGECCTVGFPTVFIRLTGCPLRCQYCDTAYAFHGGKWHDVDEIIQTVKRYNTQYVTVTGGEPLAQGGCLNLLATLCEENYSVSLETSGAFDISKVDVRVSKVLDIKTPGSKEVGKNLWQNLSYLLPHDQIKFVICDREDYLWAISQLRAYNLNKRCEVIFSPSYHQVKAYELAEWILKDQLPVRFQIQLHKFLWGEAQGR